MKTNLGDSVVVERADGSLVRGVVEAVGHSRTLGPFILLEGDARTYLDWAVCRLQCTTVHRRPTCA